MYKALGLRRGDAFEGLHTIPALQIESVRLAKRRAAALADRIDVDLAFERSAAVVPELHVLVEEQPLFERHWGQLMTALHCSGNTHEALALFSRAREIFVVHLGVEPSGELCGLHMQILREEPSESLPRLPTAKTVRGEPGNTDDIPSDASELSVTSNRPSAVMSLLEDKRALVRTGTAGIGKTHLLRTLAATFETQHRLTPLLSASPLSKAMPLGVFLGTTNSIPEDRISPAALIEFFTRPQRKPRVIRRVYAR